MPLPWGLDAGAASRKQLLGDGVAEASGADPPAGHPAYPTPPVGATASIGRLQPPLLVPQSSSSSTGGGGVFAPPYDVVLASEVAYRTEVFPALLTTLKSLCARPAAAAQGGSDATSAPPRGKTLVLLAARRRACCDLAEFLQAASADFTVRLLAGEIDEEAARHLQAQPEADGAGAPATRAAGGGPKGATGAAKGGKAPVAGGGKPRFFVSPEMAAFSRGASALSKTSWAPLLFALEPR